MQYKFLYSILNKDQLKIYNEQRILVCEKLLDASASYITLFSEQRQKAINYLTKIPAYEPPGKKTWLFKNYLPKILTDKQRQVFYDHGLQSKIRIRERIIKDDPSYTVKIEQMENELKALRKHYCPQLLAISNAFMKKMDKGDK